MVKKNVLTPVLAGVLGVTVAGSGVLYVLDNKGSDTSDDKDTSVVRDKVGETTFSRVQDKVESTAEKIEMAFKGELDFAYNGKAEITFGPAVTDQLGFVPKPIAIEAKTKQKAGLSEAVISAAYDSKSLATLNFIADSNNNKIYIKVPELSSAYLTLSEDDLMKLLEEYEELMGGINPGNMTALSISSMQNPDMDALMELLEQIDIDALLDDFEEYVDVIKNKIPDGKDNGTIKGDINGNSYSYTVKTVDITGQIIVDIIDSVAEKAKDDKVLKDTFDKLGMGSNYDQIISSLRSSIKDGSNGVDLSKTMFTVDVYYSGDDPTGIRFDLGGQATFRMVAINSSDVLGIDLSVNARDTEVLTLKGAFKDNDGAVSGDISLVANGSADSVAEFNLSVKDLKDQGDMFSGSIMAEVKSNKDSVAFSLDSASTADKLDLTFKFLADSQEGVTVKLTGEKTDATDVSLPTGDAYPLDENGIKNYMNTVDPDKFINDLKAALGEELWNKLTA